MKKVLILTVAVLMLVTMFAGCGQTPANNPANAAQSSDEASGESSADAGAQEAQANDTETGSGYPIPDSYTAYLNAKSVVMEKLSDGLSSNTDSLSASFTLIGVAMIDLAMLPVSFFGMGEQSVTMGLAMMSASDVKYSENGNTYSVAYSNSDGVAYEFSGTYDPAADAMVCISKADGKENFYSEYRKTSFGYVSQYYFVNDDGTTSLYQFSTNGEDGTFGVSTNQSAKPAALTGSEAPDFPTALPEWYSITGSTITGKTSDGKDLSFEYVPTETE